MTAYTEKPKLLWVDVTLRRQNQLRPDLSGLCEPYVESGITGISDSIRKINPQILCFDYDFPNTSRLKALQQTKHLFPSVPVLMFTLQHSEALATWAFRTGVRDFIVKPVDHDYVVQRIAALLEFHNERKGGARHNLLPPEPIPVENRFHDHAHFEKVTFKALSFIEKHLPEEINLAKVAKECGLRRFQFCRAFKSEHGISFRNYLVLRRIEQAKHLLTNPNATVGDVAFTVGFNDPSHFTRMFKRHVGCAPSVYRMTQLPEGSSG